MTQGRKGDWFALERYTPITKEKIVSEYWDLYKKEGLPDKWVFNDFGHMTCYYFKDLNKNGILDGKEHREGDMIHPTPANEARVAQGRANAEILLDESHGCIHVRPADIDDMIRRGYLRTGNALYVHPYSEKAPTDGIDTREHYPFEVHFFPTARKLAVKGRVMVP